MTTYNGIFIREYLGQIPNWSGTGGIWNASPDAITGGGELQDPSQFISTAGYAMQYPAPFGVNQPNFVYVRGVNTTTTAITGRVWLYWAQSSTYLWPSAWQSATISVAGLAVNYQSITAAAAPPWTDHTEPPPVGAPIATTMPFIVTPNATLPTSDGFALIAIMDNNPTIPAVPPTLPGPFNNVGELANWVSSSPNVGWIETTVSYVVPAFLVTQTFNTGSAGGTYLVSVACNNIPTDGMVSLEAAGPDYSSSVNLYQQPVTSSNMQIGQTVTWPAGFVTSICANFVQGNTAPPAGASIRIVVTIPASEG